MSSISEVAAGRPTFWEAFRYWLGLGFINFGGPAGQIAMMHKDLVDARGWIDDRLFLRALNFCMLLPGPEAHQLAVYIGWRLNGYMGGVAAGTFFLLPSAVLMAVLSWLAAAHGDAPLIMGAFHGISAAVVAIVVEAVWRIGKKALRHRILYAFAGCAFVLGQFFGAPFPLVVMLAGLAGVVLTRTHPDIFCHRASGSKDCAMEDEPSERPLPSWRHVARVCLVFAGIWLAVALAVFSLAGPAEVLKEIMVFFTKAAFVTFGGAYAVLAYIADSAVAWGWLTEGDMLLGLGLAETTPGPLIMVTQFVGFFAAWNAKAGDPLLFGLLGAALTTFCTFLPSFMFIFAGAPYLEAITSNRWMRGALVGITAAVVGVILKLAVYFATKTFFPVAGGMDWFALFVAAGAFMALWRYRISMHLLVLGSGLAGLLWRMAT